MTARGQGRLRNGQFAPDPTTPERAVEAMRLRTRGMSYREIAQEMGFNNESAVRDLVSRALLATLSEPADDLRQLELQRLDFMWAAVLKVLERHHVTVSNGKVIYLGDTPLHDDAPILAAVDRLVKIQDRRAKLLGLDAPQRVEVLTIDAIDAELARLTQQLGGTEVPQTPATA
jgi:hypothetical protein